MIPTGTVKDTFTRARGDRLVELGELGVEQLQQPGEGLGGEARAGDGARRSGEQVCTHPLGQHLRQNTTRVVVSGQEPRYPGRLDPGDGRCRIVLHERERDLPVHRGEQRRGRVVGLQDHPQLVFHGLLGLQQPVAVTGQRPDLGQQRRRHRER
jgi:hypothetical protein